MNPLDPVLFCELPVISKIIQDEMWLEGERRGCEVARHDAVVRENVCRVILRVGQQLRESIEAQLAAPDAEERRSVAIPGCDEAA